MNKQFGFFTAIVTAAFVVLLGIVLQGLLWGYSSKYLDPHWFFVISQPIVFVIISGAIYFATKKKIDFSRQFLIASFVILFVMICTLFYYQSIGYDGPFLSRFFFRG